MSYKFIKIRPSNTGFDIRINFWADNYQVRYIEPFKKLYDQDTSKDKQQSSNFMWCIWLYQDPNYDNKIYRLSEQDKKSAIKSYCPEFDFEDDLINECLLAYPEQCLSDAAQKFRKSLIAIDKLQTAIDEKFLEEKVTFDTKVPIGNNRYEKLDGNAKQFLALKKQMAILWKDYEPLKSMFEEEQNDIKVYGGGKETLLGKGGLVLINDD